MNKFLKVVLISVAVVIGSIGVCHAYCYEYGSTGASEILQTNEYNSSIKVKSNNTQYQVYSKSNSLSRNHGKRQSRNRC